MPMITLELTPPLSDPPVRGVRLFFDLTRTEFTREFSTDSSVAPTREGTKFDFPLAQLEFAGPLRESFSVALEYQGEEPSWTWEPFWLPLGPPALRFVTEPELLGEERFEIPEDAEFFDRLGAESFAVAWAGHVDRYNSWVCKRIWNEPDADRRRAMLFFVDLDQNTMEIQLRAHCGGDGGSGSECVEWPDDGCDDFADRIRALARTSRTLVELVEWRCREEFGERGSKPDVDKSDLVILSGAQRPIYERHFAKAGLLRAELIQAAYELFAVGDLREPGRAESRWNARPDSLFYLLFSEFAIQCIEHSVDADLWLPVLPALVSTQELFARAHPPGWQGHNWSSLPKPTIQIGTAGLDFARVQRLYERLDYQGLCAAHTANSLYLRAPLGRTLYSGDTPMADEKRLTKDSHWQRAAEILAASGDAGANFDEKWVVMGDDADRAVRKIYFDREKALEVAEDEGLSAYGPFRMAATSEDGWNSTSGDPHPMNLAFKKDKVVSMEMRNGKSIEAKGRYTIFIE